MKPTRQQMKDALEKAARNRMDRQARRGRIPLDDWPDGPPLGDEDGMRRYEAALRQWHGAQDT